MEERRVYGREMAEEKNIKTGRGEKKNTELTLNISTSAGWGAFPCSTSCCETYSVAEKIPKIIIKKVPISEHHFSGHKSGVLNNNIVSMRQS